VADRALWWEVGAVLAVCVVPQIAWSIEYLLEPSLPRSYWLDSLMYYVGSACLIYMVLYLIYRSGEGWAKFGLGRPRRSDMFLGLLMLLATIALYALVARRIGYGNHAGSERPPPEPWENLLLALSYMATGFSEELVCRSYLVTRLEQLRRSSVQAVLFS